MPVQSLGQEDSLEEGMTPIPVFLPGNPVDRGAWQATQSLGSQRVRHDGATFAFTFFP